MKITRRAASVLAAVTVAAGAAVAGVADSGPASAATGFVQGRSVTPAATGTTASLAFTSNIAAGHLLVVIPSSWQSTHTTVSGVTDTLGDTWAKATVASAAGQETELWYASTGTHSGSDTVTVTWAASAYRALSIAEYSGVTGALDAAHGAGDTSAGTSHSSGATTTAAAGDLVLGGYGDPGSGGTVTAGSGYTMATTDTPNTNMSVAAEHNLSLGSSAPVTATFTSSTVAQAATVVAAFTASGGGGGGQAPVVTTNAATGVGQTAATLNGSVNPEGASTTYQFQYGTTISYGTNVPSPAGTAGSDSTVHSESASITGLTAGTTYHYRITAANATGTTNGSDQTFTTSAAGGGPTSLVCPVVNNPTSGQVITCTYQ